MSKTKIIIISLVSVIGAICLTVGVLYLINYMDNKNVTDFGSCVAKNNKILETSPRQCTTKFGKTYVEQTTESAMNEFVSLKGVVIKLENLNMGDKVMTPFVINGEVPGNWSSEGSFTIEVVDDQENVIGKSTAVLDGDWMTDNYVNFSANIEYNLPTNTPEGRVILQKDNPSGLSENDDSVEIQVWFGL